MPDYIERKAAINAICRLCSDTTQDKCRIADICNYVCRLEAIPAADARPVVRGQWIKHNATHVQKGGMYLECSCCHEYITVLGHVFAYCPNCGADMRELQNG